MDTLAKRKKLHDYISEAGDDKIDALFNDVIEDTHGRYEWWNDEEMVAELEQISADMESGKDPGISWEDLKKDLTARLKGNAQ